MSLVRVATGRDAADTAFLTNYGGAVTLQALERLHTDLGLPPVLMRVNNRRLAQGFYRGLDITDPASIRPRPLLPSTKL